MKLSFFLMFFVVLSASANIDVMSQRVNLDFRNTDLTTVFKSLESQTGHIFVYSVDRVQADRIQVSVQLKDAELAQALDVLLKDLPYKYSIEGQSILIIPVPRQATREISPTPQKTIKGSITDETGAPLVGATVIVKGTTRGVATDVNGRYSISVPADVTTLEISFLGYKKVEVQIGNRTEIDIKLESDTQVMEDVVVTGYQTISKERATGAYSIVSAHTLEQKPTANLSEALAGLVPGLTVESQPVEGTTRFIIRGRGTLQDNQADRDPLIVVDGFPISGYSDSNDPFSSINPNDVESVTVLKDAAATSIYGARAANGVIVITTKKGKTGNKLDISADAYWSVSSRVDLDNLFDMASAESQFRFVELIDSYYRTVNLTGTNNPYLTPSARQKYMSAPYSMLFERNRGSLSKDAYDMQRRELIDRANRGVWKDDLNEYLFRHMVHQQYNVALRGATERLNYAFSVSFDDEKGFLQGSNNRRVLLNLNSNAKLTKNLSFDLAISTTFAKEQDDGMSVSGINSWLSPWIRLVDDDGNFVPVSTSETIYGPVYESEYAGKIPADWTYNPVTDREYTDNLNKTMNYRIQGGFDYNTAWGLNLIAKGQYEQRRYTTHTLHDPESFYVRNLYNTYSTLNSETGRYTSYFPSGGIFTDGGNTYESYNLRGQVDYNGTFGMHAINVLAGTEIVSSTTEVTPTITRYGYNEYTNSVLTSPDYVSYRDNIFGISKRLPFEALGTLSTMEDRFFSIYANAAYTYNDKYSLTASFRRDASNFQSESQRDKFSPFWSVGASWLISHEGFMSQADWVNQLKVRASLGIAGVAAGKSSTSSVTTLRVYPGDITYSANEPFNTVAARGNNTLTWEKSRTFNVGVDASLFGNKLNGSFEFYNRYSYDVLTEATVPAILQGANNATFNNAEILNRGVELTLGTDLPVAGDLRWNGTLNYSYNFNEVKKFHLTTSFPAFNPGYVEGYPVDLINVLRPAGYTPEGFIILQGKDGTQDIIQDYESSHRSEQVLRNEGQTIGENNWAYYLGSSTPKSNLSFTNAFTWKGLTLSFMITGRFGYYVYRNDHFTPVRTNETSYSKQLDKALQVYDEGYGNQTGYSAMSLPNAENAELMKAGVLMYMGNAARSFRDSYIKGDHIRLNEIFLGYDLPQRWMAGQNVFSRVNIYARATNLGLIWSKNREMDPDYTVGTLKPMPTFMFGLKLGFKNWK